VSLLSPTPTPTDPEHRDVPAIPKPKTNHFDWPDNLIERIKKVMGTPCSTPTASEFRFEISEEAMQHNLEVLDKYEFDLGKALDTQHDSPLGPGMEFRPTDVLHEIFGLHPLWNRMEAILKNGSKWPLTEISEDDRAKDLQEALTFSNHKGAASKPALLKKLISKDVKYGYSLPLPLDSITKVKGLVMAPMNIMAQNTIDEHGRIVPKDRLTIPTIKVGFGAVRALQSTAASRRSSSKRHGMAFAFVGSSTGLSPHDKNIQITKFSQQKSTTNRLTVAASSTSHFATALTMTTQLPDDAAALITLRLTFGGAPCPFEWGAISEIICDLANELVQCEDWDPTNLHASVQKDIPPPQFLDDGIPFAEGRELIVDIPVDPRGKADVYIDDTTGLTIDIPGSNNVQRMAAAIPLAIEVAARPNDPNEPIPREKMVAEDKLKAEGGLSETKIILGWLFNF